MKLSVVVITRNEASTVRACIESVTAAIDEAHARGRIDASEVLLVDSASEDNTVALAREFPIRIFQLPPDVPLSAGAGSFLGCRLATGDAISIINGDMTIERSYFAEALSYLQGDVGAILGIAVESLRGRSLAERLLQAATAEVSPEFKSPSGSPPVGRGTSAGTMLIGREALDRVGGYNPFLVAAEDFDMRIRLGKAGYRVINVPVLQGHHFMAEGDEVLGFSDIFRTLFRNSVGLGQLLRNNAFDRDYSRSIGRKLLTFSEGESLLHVLVAICGATAFLAYLHLIDWILLPVPLVAIAMLVHRLHRFPSAFGWRERVILTFVPALQLAVRLVGLARGYLRGREDAEAYPLRFVEVPTDPQAKTDAVIELNREEGLEGWPSRKT